MEKVGKEISSKPLWEELSKGYVNALESPYHKHRLGVIFKLLPESLFNEGKRFWILVVGMEYYLHRFWIKAQILLELISLRIWLNWESKDFSN